MRKASLMSRYANPGTPEYRQKGCVLAFFRGCKLPKSFHISFSAAKIKVLWEYGTQRAKY